MVITAPTGTGKSTQVPRWLKGKTLVIQPRRVAARGVAARIAELEGTPLGQEVGYRVREENCSSDQTRLLVVTPGIVLHRPELLRAFATVVIDEIHERRLDTDLILALLRRQRAPTVAMSATVEGEKVAEYLEGQHLSISARTFPVEVSYADSGDNPPRPDRLASRVRRALFGLGDLPGDVLVFLPGKSEIVATCAELEQAHSPDWQLDVRALHGGLSLKQQAAVLAPATAQAHSRPVRRVIVTTNIAETSLTVPGVRVVIDSGLVRRTNYYEGRSYLGLSPIAMDSAAQRTGRAGRTAPGVCVRLFSPSFRLQPQTLPEIERESLTPLLLAVASLGLQPHELHFMTSPREFAWQDARSQLLALGALDGQDELTATGKELARLPLDPWHAGVLIAANKQGCLLDAIDLVAALEQPRAHLLLSSVDDETLERVDCDLVALVTAVRKPRRENEMARAVAHQAQESRKRLRRLLAGWLPAQPNSQGMAIDRDSLLAAVLSADPSSGCVARRRKSRLTFSAGGTEMELERHCRATRAFDVSGREAAQAEAVVVLSTHALSQSAMKRTIRITAAAPVPLSFLAQCGLGEERIGSARLKQGRLISTTERIWAGKTILAGEVEPQGELARQAITRLFLQGSLHKQQKMEAERRIARSHLAANLGRHPDHPYFAGCKELAALDTWLPDHLKELGVETGRDLELLSADDFLPPDVPKELAAMLEERFPLEVDIGDCLYRTEYDLTKRQVLLIIVRGARAKPPPANYLPRFEGLKVYAEAGGSYHLVRRG